MRTRVRRIHLSCLTCSRPVLVLSRSSRKHVGKSYPYATTQMSHFVIEAIVSLYFVALTQECDGGFTISSKALVETFCDARLYTLASCIWRESRTRVARDETLHSCREQSIHKRQEQGVGVQMRARIKKFL